MFSYRLYYDNTPSYFIQSIDQKYAVKKITKEVLLPSKKEFAENLLLSTLATAVTGLVSYNFDIKELILPENLYVMTPAYAQLFFGLLVLLHSVEAYKRYKQ